MGYIPQAGSEGSACDQEQVDLSNGRRQLITYAAGSDEVAWMIFPRISRSSKTPIA